VIFECINAVEHAVVEELLAQFIPEMLNGVQFWGLRWQRQEEDIVRNLQGIGGVPTCAVQNPDDFVEGMTRSDCIQEYPHASGVDVRQNQGIEMTVGDIDGGLGMGVFVCQHGLT
jgi:hypothetical protein